MDDIEPRIPGSERIALQEKRLWSDAIGQRICLYVPAEFRRHLMQGRQINVLKTRHCKDAPVHRSCGKHVSFQEYYSWTFALKWVRLRRIAHCLAKTPTGCRSRIMKQMIPHEMTTSTFDLPGFRVVRTLGIVRGIVVRSRSVFGTIGASLQTMVGGDITLFTNLCEKAREDAFERMLEHAGELGANAVIGVRYDATEVMQGVTEVLCYGTAATVERG
jgi:uncharacterized protein YbjQ (UPF0145 family)